MKKKRKESKWVSQNSEENKLSFWTEKNRFSSDIYPFLLKILREKIVISVRPSLIINLVRVVSK
jgi:hypothetical protein